MDNITFARISAACSSAAVRISHLLTIVIICCGLLISGSRCIPVLAPSLPLGQRWEPPVMWVHEQVGRSVAARRRRTASAPPVPGGEAAACYCRYSSDMQSEASNADQLRTCRDRAVQNQHTIVDQFVFGDEAISGTKRSRTGLNAMRQAAEERRFSTLYLFSLSRLARNSVITIPLMKRLVHVLGIRVITIVEGIDTDKDGWELIVAIISAVNEQYIRELAENSRRGQIGRLLNGYCIGDYCFGYGSQIAPGFENVDLSRGPKPPKVYTIKPEEAAWVVRIFYWFVVEQRSISWIARELNRRGAPKDHRAKTAVWHHALVAELLARKKYIGIWPWGQYENKRDPEADGVWQEERPLEESGKWTRELPHLRLIDDETFYKAQERLQTNRERTAGYRNSKGQLQGSAGGDNSEPRHLLSNLIECKQCHKCFWVGGTNGKYMFCHNYRAGVCTCGTTLRRDLAERLILDEIGRRILRDDAWTDAVFTELRRAWEQRSARLPTELRAAEERLKQLEQATERLLDSVEKGQDVPELLQRIAKRRIERGDTAREVERLRTESATTGPAPTREWLCEKLADLGGSLRGTTPAAAHALAALVGGRIVVHQVPIEGKKRCFLRGTFTISAVRTAQAVCGFDLGTDGVPELGCEEVVIDFRDTGLFDERALQAKELFDQGMMNVDIGDALGCGKSMVRKLLLHAGKLLGVTIPDGRERRASLSKKHRELPLYQRIANDAVKLFGEGLPLGEIAKRLNVNHATARAAIDYWHTSRGLPVPIDGRSRRKSLPRNSPARTG